MATKKAKLKKPTVKDLPLKVLIAEGEREHLRRSLTNTHDVIAGLVAALQPFAFRASRDQFKGYEGNMTSCLICDSDVQKVREILSVRGLY